MLDIVIVVGGLLAIGGVLAALIGLVFETVSDALGRQRYGDRTAGLGFACLSVALLGAFVAWLAVAALKVA